MIERGPTTVFSYSTAPGNIVTFSPISDPAMMCTPEWIVEPAPIFTSSPIVA